MFYNIVQAQTEIHNTAPTNSSYAISGTSSSGDKTLLVYVYILQSFLISVSKI